jgi:hypothetical protein
MLRWEIRPWIRKVNLNYGERHVAIIRSLGGWPITWFPARGATSTVII